MSLFYFDTSATLKLLFSSETYANELAGFFDTNVAATWVSSNLLRVELIRGVARRAPVALPHARNLLSAFDYIEMDDEIVEAAMDEPDRALRSLDAIHLATARVLGPELDALITYDERMAKAAADAGMTVLSPGA